MDIGEKSREKLRVFVKAQLLTMQQDMLSRLPENTDIDLPDIPESLVDQALEVYVGTNNRQLYSFFDEHFLYLTIDYCNKNWFCRINENELLGRYMSREEAEALGFKECFNQLEQL